ncbi:ankyrin repeat domain-containing protein [Exiguobacterium sp. s141]|uniref:ankyrin repeat domain-containing protein n=1 Tax=Exiguobacterium sp. s141 TaxID=2751240 RepID=UPI001BE64DFF|nr:ankyrin repeat domain-containing protein [Exiguobacterium sp. s141]
MENTHNYSFLEREWPDYANLGHIIESKLMMEPEQAVLKMKVLSELLIHDLLEKNSMRSSASSTTEERLHLIQTVEGVPGDIVQKLRALRETDHTLSREKQSLHSLNKQLVEVLHWFAKSYGAIDYAPLSYNAPLDEKVEQSSNQLALYEVNYADLEEEIANESNIVVSRFTRTERDKKKHLSEGTASSMVQNTKKPKSKFKRTLTKFLVTAAVVLIAFLGINAYTVAQNHEAFPNSLDRALVENVNGILGFSYGESAMNKAMEQKNSERIESLLAQGVDKNKLYPNGETLATYAVKEGDNKLLLSLLEDSADMSKQNADGETALEIAYETDNERALGLLGAEKAPLSVSFVQNNLIGYWKADNEVVELKEEGNAVKALIYVNGEELALDLSNLTMVDKNTLKFENKEYSRGTENDKNTIVASQSAKAEDSSASRDSENTSEDEVAELDIEETVTETDSESDSQAELDALLAEREEDEIERLKKNIAFMNSIVGFWDLTSEWEDERFQTLVIQEDQEDTLWGFHLLSEGKIYPYADYDYYYRESILLKDDKAELKDEQSPRYVVTKLSDDKITVNLKVGINDLDKKEVFKTLTYTKIPKSTVSTELLEKYPKAFQ